MDWVPTIFYVFKVGVFVIGMFFAVKWHYDRDRVEGHATGVRQSSRELRLFVTMIIVCGISFLGIVYAACSGQYSDGGSGGAIGCVLIFVVTLMSLMAKPTAEPGAATLNEGVDQLAGLKIQTERLRAASVARLASAEREKVYLGIAGFVSTLAWKFGQIPAFWLDFRH